jgi:hypothetical protein
MQGRKVLASPPNAGVPLGVAKLKTGLLELVNGAELATLTGPVWLCAATPRMGPAVVLIS